MAQAKQQSWQLDKAWADGHLAEIKRVVGIVVSRIVDVTPSSYGRDTRGAIDYDITITAATMACRIRRAVGCPQRDLTMTTARPSGTTPEAVKIARGDVRWYLYAWAESGRFVDWMFVDLHVVRSKDLIAGARRQPTRYGGEFLYIPSGELTEAGALVGASWMP